MPTDPLLDRLLSRRRVAMQQTTGDPILDRVIARHQARGQVAVQQQIQVIEVPFGGVKKPKSRKKRHAGLRVNELIPEPRPPGPWITPEQNFLTGQTYKKYRAPEPCGFTEAAIRVKAMAKAATGEAGGAWWSRGPVLWMMRVHKLSFWYDEAAQYALSLGLSPDKIKHMTQAEAEAIGEKAKEGWTEAHADYSESYMDERWHEPYVPDPKLGF